MVYKRKAREAQERHSGKRHRTSPSPTPSAPDPASESPEATPPPEVSEAPQHDPQTAVEMTEELADLIVERLNAPHNPTTNYSGAQPNFKAFRSKARGHHGGEAPRTQVLCVQESELTQVQISQRQQAARCALPPPARIMISSGRQITHAARGARVWHRCKLALRVIKRIVTSG